MSRSRTMTAQARLVLSLLAALVLSTALGAVAPAPAPASTNPQSVAPLGDLRLTLASRLNHLLEPDQTGVIIRAGRSKPTPLSSATFVRNDIVVPTAVYSYLLGCSGDAAAPLAWDGYRTIGWMAAQYAVCDRNPNRDFSVLPTLTVVSGPRMRAVPIAAAYATDAAAVIRCTSRTTVDCYTGSPSNVYSGSGRGCVVGQIVSTGGGRATAVGADCRCPVGMSGPAWVSQLMTYARPAAPYTYFTGNNRGRPYWSTRSGKAPMSALFNQSACWTTDLRQVVSIQNELWRTRQQWWNGLTPQAPTWGSPPRTTAAARAAMRYYMGWNELLVNDDALYANVDAHALVLATGVERLEDMPAWALKAVGRVLKAEYDQGPLTDIVLMRQIYSSSTGRWQRQFFTQPFDFRTYGVDVLIACPRPAVSGCRVVPAAAA